MKHLKDLHDQLERANHPAAGICGYLLRHSNSPVYLRDNLYGIIEAIEADTVAEARIHAAFRNKPTTPEAAE